MSEKSLKRIFGAAAFKILLEKESSKIQSIEVSDLGLCFAWKAETYASLKGIHRLSLVRDFAIGVSGPDSFIDSLSYSPSVDSDGLFPFENNFLRLWADIGVVSPEALAFVQSPPTTYSKRVKDVILVPTESRMMDVATQVRIRWSQSVEAYVWINNTDIFQKVVHPLMSRSHPWKYPSVNKLKNMLVKRINSERRDCISGELAAEMTSLDWTILADAGNNPLLTRWEMANLLGVDIDYGPNVRNWHNTGIPTAKKVAKRIEILEAKNLLEEPRREDTKGRLFPSWRGIDLLAGHWGVSLSDFKQFQPWPQSLGRRDQLRYSTGWLSKMYRHQSLCRQFSLSLVLGGRSISNVLGRARVEIVSMIGSRLLFVDSSDNEKIRWVIPDGYAKVNIERAPWNDGAGGKFRSVAQHAVFIEIDRATNPLERLDDRLDRYRQVWMALENINPVLVWVIMGTPYRENYLLDQMRERGLLGYTVLSERLVLKKDNEWWVRNPTYTHFDLEYEAIGGMAPYREIWMSTETGSKLVPFLNHQPWYMRKLELSKPQPKFLDVYRRR